MSLTMNYLFIICCLASIYSCYGCQMDGVVVWQLPITVDIEDYHDGIILERGISNIIGYSVTSYADLNGGPYVDVSIADSLFVLRTNAAYRDYEENETSQEMSLTFTFTCGDGTTSLPLNVRIDINDNNNNAPLFKTEDTAASADTTYEFTIAPPLPPGFLITDCVRDIIVRDIDLTTYRIDFGIEDNPYIEIEYDEAGSTVDKEFKAMLRTTTFIRSLPEPIVLRISATDVDRTEDEPITTYTTVTIHGSEEFELPTEPVFSEPFYLANYENDQITLEQAISLQQGFDAQVEFRLEGDYAEDHFDINVQNNLVNLVVTSPLSTELLRQGQIFLVVRATRAYTVGASATIVVQLPEAVNLGFQQPHYEGEIVDNTLQLTDLILSQGYQESPFTVTVEDYPLFFTASVVGNIITLSMTPLDANIIEENNFINLRVTASTAYSSATTIVTLEVIKDDTETPVFEKLLYDGTYDTTVGLTLEPILLVQGFDDTVQVTFSGDHQNYFELVREGASSTLRVVGSLPPNLLSETHLLLTVAAAKPRTVGASTVVSITLPAVETTEFAYISSTTTSTLLNSTFGFARELQFQAPSYRGSIQDNILTIETISLSVGYDEDVTFSLSGEYSSSFMVSNVQNQVSINLITQLPQEVIAQNDVLLLTITAAGQNTLPTTAAVLVDIIKDDITTPVFSEHIYYGNYIGLLDIDMGNINLVQGYDSTVTFRIVGENSQYFQINHIAENSLTLSVLSTIPEEVIFNEKVFVFNVFADKPLTVGANAAISIKFSEELTEPTVMQFGKNTYAGSLEDNILSLENIVLETGFAVGTEFHLTGDYNSYFTTANSNNVVTLSLPSGLSAEILDNNKFIVLELEARRERAVSVFATIVIDLVEAEVVTPVFSQAYYTGIYTEDNVLQFEQSMMLLQGFDETVTFGLEGESSVWFAVVQNGNTASLVASSDVPQDVLDRNHQLLFTVVANKPNVISGRSAISIDLPKEVLPQEILRFEQSSYEGQIDGSYLQIPTIILTNELTDNLSVELTGDHAAYFSVSHDLNTINVDILDNIPPELLSDNDFLVIGITASKPDAVRGYTTLILTVVKAPQIVTPIFEEAFYTGEFSDQDGLLFEHTIRLVQGFDDSVSFTLDGDGSEWFTLTQNGQNSMSLSTIEGGIPVAENLNHLIFSVLANKPGTMPSHAAIMIHFTDFPGVTILGFEQSSYLGTIEDGISTIEPIVLNEGFSTAVTFTLHGDLASYFNLVVQGPLVTVELQSEIPEQSVPSNNIVLLELRAAAPQTVPAFTAVVFEVVQEKTATAEELIFSEPYYTGQFSEAGGLVFETVISLSAGFDQNVQFALEGDHAQWFTLAVEGNSVAPVLSSAIPPAVIANNVQLLFVVTANKPNSNIARLTVVISLVDEFTDATILGFERSSYLGTIEDDISTIEPIVLNEGFSTAVTFTLHGDLASYFNLVVQGPSVTVVLQNAIPEQSVPSNNIVLLELRAAAPQTVPAFTAVVFEVVQEATATAEELIFSEPYYTGQFSEAGGLVFETVISLSAGFDPNVQFALEGDHAQWFTLAVEGNSVVPVLSSAIPPAVIANNVQLLFVVTANKPNSNIATSTVVISLVDEFTDATILGFERSSYLGTIEDGISTIEPIVLNEGFSTAVTFTLHGDLASYFNLVVQGPSVTVLLQNAIPEQSVPSNNIVLLELRAAAPQTVPAFTAVVFEVVQEATATAEELIFSEPYYTGQFSEAGGLVFETVISLSAGFDPNVQFALEGDHAQWFTLAVEGNSVVPVLSSAIPPAVIANNVQLLFVVTANKPNSNIATSTVVISLVDEFTDATILGFERSSYLGTIEDGISTIEPIVLNEGFSTAVTFTLHGDLASYFNLVVQGPSVTVVLQNAIPEQSVPSNNIVLLELRAAAPQTVPAFTAVVFEVVQEATATAEELIFSEPYYTGQFSEAGGLVFETVISLSAGFDPNVQFALEGDHAQWFTLAVEGNSVVPVLSSAIPPAVIANNVQLLFVVTANKPNSNIATSTVVISLVDEFTDATILGFERSSYLGTIEDGISTIEPIVLNEGFSTAVTFTLHGDLASYFNLVVQGPSVTVVLQNAIPEQSVPSNNIVLLELRAAAPQTVPAFTAVVFEVVQEATATAEELIFSEPYYTGQFSEAGGLVFETVISLSAGFDPNVQFALEGDHAQWFTLAVEGNSVVPVLSSAIPPAVIANNVQLLFVVTANKPNSNIATSTVVISLVDEFTDATILGFERSSYLGTIEDGISTIEPIVLNEGFSTAVTFTLHGDLASYFNLVVQGPSVTVVLQNAIPEQSVPSNNIVLLELRAAAPQTVPAFTAVVFEVVQEATATAEELIFSEPYYTGQFSEAGGLVFETVISLSAGFDPNVQFALEGDHAQWFTLAVEGNSVVPVLSSAIPPAVIANNVQLLFVVTANKQNSNIATSTVVISLVDEFTDATILGFERSSYLGTIEDGISTIEPIVLNEGFSTAVTFTLHGDLASYFNLVVQGSSVTVVLQNAIPEQSVPSNNIVLLELRAAAPQTVPAFTAVVFEVVQEATATAEELIFSEPYYTGQFSEAGGLVFETVISLSAGFDPNVQFALEGDHAQWFTLAVEGNSVVPVLSSAIPPAVIANNVQLLFVVTANKPNSNIATSTVVISLVDEFTDATILGFERSSYLGTIEDGISTIEPIVLNEGFSTAVTFTLHGDLASSFNLVVQGPSVTVLLQNAIPEQSVPSNNIVLLELRAAAPQTVPAFTAVVFEVVQEATATAEELIFSEPYYTGQFSEAGGLVFETVISLSAGFDPNVQFALEGDHAQWFTLAVEGNSVVPVLSSAIPPAVIANNVQLLFVVTANKPNSNIATSTVVISLVDEFTDATILGFERSSYLGTIEDGISTIEPIVLNEGFSTAVTFTLHGDLASYFNLVVQGPSVTVVLQNAIPEQSVPSNNIVLLELRAAAPQTVPAFTAVVFEVVQEATATAEELIFSEPYYTGQFSEAGGLVFETVISLSAGFDQNVQFALEGDHAQWFTLAVEGNSVAPVLSSAIPPAVIANNVQLLFVVTANKPNSNIATSTVVISLVDEFTDATILGFERSSYLGTIEDGISTIEPIVLNEGFSTAVTFTLHGDSASYFNLVVQGPSVTVVLQNAIPEQSVPSNNIVLLELRAAAPQTVPAFTAVVFEVVQDETAIAEELIFSEPYYTGQFSEAGGLVFETVISLSAGFDPNVQFALEGDHAQWFTLAVEGNSVVPVLSSAIPPAVIANNVQLLFVVTANKANSNVARSTVVISLVDEFTDATILGFERSSYLGTIEDSISTIEPIVLNEGFSTAVTFTLHGDLASYFNLVVQGPSVTVVLLNAIPEQSVPSNNIVLLELRAAAPQTVPAFTAVVFEVVQEATATAEELIFSEPYYTGQFSEAGGLVFETVISLSAGFDQNVQFALEGDHAQWFTLAVEGNSVAPVLSSAIPPAVIANNVQLLFVVTANKPNSNIATSTVVISLVDEFTDATILGFERSSYLGTIEDGISTIEPIVLNEGFSTAVTFTLHGDLASYFNLVVQGPSVTVVLQNAIPEQSVPSNNIVLLELRAAAPQTVPAFTAVVFEVVQEETATAEELIFSEPYYTGQFSEAGGLVFETVISLSAGFDQNVQFALEGDHAQWFTLAVEGNSVAPVLSSAIPPAVIANNVQLLFVVTANKPNSNIARSTVVISLFDGTEPETGVAFDKVLYEGTINLEVVQHEPIIITGYDESLVEIFGDYRGLFSASASEGEVTVVAAGSLGLPGDVTYVALELRAGGAGAALLLHVAQSGPPELPSVTFGSPSYVLRTDMAHTGLVGQVSAVASNGETVAYSLAIDNAHLQERVSVNGDGEIHLSAPINTGVYSFQVIATSVITQVQATATVQLTVEATSICGVDDHVLPPLIILDRDEEEPHANLVVLDSATQPGCQFRLTNRWPLEHDWLYVDETGLHARSIDREDPRIAFMALSQVQVELVLECPSDSQARAKRSVNTSSRLDWLGPYDYGSNKWILTDTILYNSRKSFVNLIVNDINDNYPIFVGKENEPIVVGYPIPELEEIVLPRALAELQATDADVGENAALRYWSGDQRLAVAPRAGSVHVRDGTALADGALLSVAATDQRGEGLTGTIQLLVKLIDVRHIAVVTVRSAFLDQEGDILRNMSAAVGYEVKALSSAVISDDTEARSESLSTRNKRDVTSAEGASLQIYVYGLIDREPVAVEQLSADITENVLTGIDVARTISLEDHLEGREIHAGRDTALLVSTIVLSVLLFILIVAIAVWFFLRWRKARNYEEFSDANSTASRDEPLEPPKADSLRKPRLNLEELKKSERRLQEMLDAPVDEGPAKPSSSAVDPERTFDTIINMAPPDTPMPIVIQSIDRLKDDANSGDEDEFGERINKARRKSVVTFNENVEKIIHVEDIPDDNSSDVEVFRL